MSSMLSHVMLRAPTHYRWQKTHAIMRPSLSIVSAIAMNSRLRFLYSLLAFFLVLGLCAYAASAILDWTPDARGLPPDIAAIQPAATGF